MRRPHRVPLSRQALELLKELQPLRKQTTVSVWANQLLERKPARLVTVAVANKMARIAWAVMARQENYRARPATA